MERLKNKVLNGWIASVFITAGLLGCFYTSPVWAQARPTASDSFRIGQTNGIQGIGEVKRAKDGKVKRLVTNDPVYVADTVTSKENSKIWLKQVSRGDEGDTSLGQSSLFTPVEYRRDGAASSFVGDVPRGVVRIIKKLPETTPESSYTLTAAAALVSVLKTEDAADFVIEVNENSETTVTVLFGSVAVRNASEEFKEIRFLKSCQKVVVEENQEPSPVMKASADEMQRLIERTTIPRTLVANIPSCQPMRAAAEPGEPAPGEPSEGAPAEPGEGAPLAPPIQIGGGAPPPPVTQPPTDCQTGEQQKQQAQTDKNAAEDQKDQAQQALNEAQAALTEAQHFANQWQGALASGTAIYQQYLAQFGPNDPRTMTALADAGQYQSGLQAAIQFVNEVNTRITDSTNALQAANDAIAKADQAMLAADDFLKANNCPIQTAQVPPGDGDWTTDEPQVVPPGDGDWTTDEPPFAPGESDPEPQKDPFVWPEFETFETATIDPDYPGWQCPEGDCKKPTDNDYPIEQDHGSSQSSGESGQSASEPKVNIPPVPVTGGGKWGVGTSQPSGGSGWRVSTFTPQVPILPPTPSTPNQPPVNTGTTGPKVQFIPIKPITFLPVQPSTPGKGPEGKTGSLPWDVVKPPEFKTITVKAPTPPGGPDPDAGAPGSKPSGDKGKTSQPAQPTGGGEWKVKGPDPDAGAPGSKPSGDKGKTTQPAQPTGGGKWTVTKTGPDPDAGAPGPKTDKSGPAGPDLKANLPGKGSQAQSQPKPIPSLQSPGGKAPQPRDMEKIRSMASQMRTDQQQRVSTGPKAPEKATSAGTVKPGTASSQPKMQAKAQPADQAKPAVSQPRPSPKPLVQPRPQPQTVARPAVTPPRPATVHRPPSVSRGPSHGRRRMGPETGEGEQAAASRDAKSSPPIVLAALDGDSQKVMELLNQPTDMNSKDSSGTTALMAAASAGNTELVKLLLDKAATDKAISKQKVINAKDNSGRTALMAACEEDRAEVAKLLVERGAGVNASD
ncbi:MAG: ankyrin repeat domain-containing protein, partial [Desulfomonile tiedjei]|nr:ankyrin repeat domain-containing protein [Desulfomonile tiedjei]